MGKLRNRAKVCLDGCKKVEDSSRRRGDGRRERGNRGGGGTKKGLEGEGERSGNGSSCRRHRK